MTLAIDIADLSFRYSRTGFSLQIPKLTIEAGKRVFVFGPSGSGKSTLLSLVGGVLSPDGGQLKILGTDLTRLNPSQRDQWRANTLGVIFQSFNLVPYLNTYENILLPLKLSRSKSARSSMQQIEMIMKRLDIHSLKEALPYQLSVGQQQRVAAARALVGQPQLIIADEPTSSLDTDRRENFIRLLMESVADIQATLLFVSHDKSLNPLFDQSVDLQGMGAVNS
jgi:putative ABC transport system ATP-binding protein